ncbi:MAG: type II secretion system protein [Myxococcales bacterium]|nr:type II secretion system protein [Myxococcales bacterium]
MNRFHRRNARGFTFVELLVVLAIVSVLMAIATMTTKYLRYRAMLAVFYSDIRLIKQAAIRFEADVGCFPPDVWRGVDPGLVNKYGWKVAGQYSTTWDQVDLKGWKGPYLRAWKRSPYGGLYDWDNYPSNYTAWGIPGGGVYVTLKPLSWGGGDGMPTMEFEQILEDQGVDRSKEKRVIAVWMGREPTWDSVPGQSG